MSNTKLKNLHMQKLEFVVEKEMKLSKAIIDKLPVFSLHDIKKILENKDVKVNNQRKKEDVDVFVGDKVVVYYVEKEQKEWYSMVYSNDNIIIVNKHAGIEVVSEKERDLLSILKIEFGEVYAVHRLDRNTEGLTIFAKNKMAESELIRAFKERKSIDKRYALLVHGRVDIAKIKRTVYLKKVYNLSKVWISEVKTSGYEPIITEFSVIQFFKDTTLLEAKLITGKTHQIRAHIAYYGYPIVGDNKYGQDGEKTMHLTAYYLAFNFNKKSKLAYLNKLNFEISPTWL